MPQPPRTLPELLSGALVRFSAQEALAQKEGEHFRFVTYRQLGAWVEQARGGLAQLGVGPGDKVAIVAKNRVEWVVLAFATYGLGAAYVPMYEAQAGQEWEYILRDSGARVVIAESSAIAETLAAALPRLPQLQAILDLSSSGPHGYSALLESGARSPTPCHAVEPTDLATLIYTSGTTGEPKGVRLLHANLVANVLASCERFVFGPGDRSLAILPWAHAFGQTAELFVLLWSGGLIAINDDVALFRENLARIRPTVLVAVPRIMNKIYAGVIEQLGRRGPAVRALFSAGTAAATRAQSGQPARPQDVWIRALAERLIFRQIRARLGGRLRYIISGSAALSREVAEFIAALGVPVYEGYGMTEASPVVSANYPGHAKLGSVGLPFRGVEVRIEPLADAPAGSGEILVRGPNVMPGYHGLPEETAQVLGADGFLRTGDMGYLDPDGYLFLTGRIKEHYKLQNGKFVVPSPLEERLKLSPLIESVLVYGENRPHNIALVVPAWDELHALTRREAPREVLARDQSVRALVASELERWASAMRGYERPRAFELLSEDFTQENGLLTPSLKPRRREIVARFGPVIDALYASQSPGRVGPG